LADGADFELLGAAEAPEASGDAVDQGAANGVVRSVWLMEVVEEGFEVAGGLAAGAFVDEDLIGEEAVVAAVLGGSVFAFGRAGRWTSVRSCGWRRVSGHFVFRSFFHSLLCHTLATGFASVVFRVLHFS